MSWQISKEDLLKMLEERKAALIPKLIALDNQEVRGAIKELQNIIKKVQEAK